MKVIIIKWLGRKFNLIVRLIIIASILILIISKLFEILDTNFREFFDEDKPSGNPIRVHVEEGFTSKVVEYEK